jgi:6-phosphogluconolactonase
VSITVLVDRTALMRAAADRIVGLAEAAIAARGRFDWALAGGSTPEALYRLLASTDYRARVDWSQVRFFWGDERCVPPDHADSNYRMARYALLETVSPPPENVHRMRGDLEPALAADRYQTELEVCFERRVGEGVPEFDLILLGMGGDGHTASLFPGTLGLDEARRWVVANRIEPLHSTRLSLTFPVINAAAHVVFLVAGADKAERLAEAVSPPAAGAEPLPAQRVRPRGEAPEWLVDAAAGARLEGWS